MNPVPVVVRASRPHISLPSFGRNGLLRSRDGRTTKHTQHKAQGFSPFAVEDELVRSQVLLDLAEVLVEIGIDEVAARPR